MGHDEEYFKATGKHFDGEKPAKSVDKSDGSGIIKTEGHVVEGKNIIGEWTRREGFDSAIDDIVDYQGFNGKPRIVNGKDEFDALVDSDHFIGERTIRANTKEELDEYLWQLKEDYFYINCGVGGAQYGQGMYCAADYTKGTVSKNGFDHEIWQYGNEGSHQATVWLTMDKSSKVLEIPESADRQECLDYVSNLYTTAYRDNKLDKNPELKRRWQEYDSKMEEVRRLNMSDKESDWDKADLLSEKLDEEYSDVFDFVHEYTNADEGKNAGIMAAEMGYDAINAAGHGETGSYTVVLNRTKLIICGGDDYVYKPK